MKIISEKTNEVIIFLVCSVLLAIVVPVYTGKWQTCFFGIFFASLAGAKFYQLYKIKKRDSAFSVDVKCTGRKVDWINIAGSKLCEFEPINKEFNDMIELSIPEDEFLIKRFKTKVREGLYYKLYFFKNKDDEKITDQEHFIGYERCVAPTNEDNDDKFDITTKKDIKNKD